MFAAAISPTYKNVIIIVSIISLLITACQPTPAEVHYSPEELAVGYTGDPDYAVAAYNKNGELLVAMTESSPSGEILKVTGAIFKNDDGSSVVVYAGDDGLPKRMVVNETIFLYSNYTNTTVDVTIILPDGSTTTEKDKELPEKSQEALEMLTQFNQTASAYKMASPLAGPTIGKALKVTLWMLELVACVSSVVSACVSVALSIVSEIADSELIGAASTIPALLSCASGHVIECWVFATESAVELLRYAEKTQDKHRAFIKMFDPDYFDADLSTPDEIETPAESVETEAQESHQDSSTGNTGNCYWVNKIIGVWELKYKGNGEYWMQFNEDGSYRFGDKYGYPELKQGGSWSCLDNGNLSQSFIIEENVNNNLVFRSTGSKQYESEIADVDSGSLIIQYLSNSQYYGYARVPETEIKEMADFTSEETADNDQQTSDFTPSENAPIYSQGTETYEDTDGVTAGCDVYYEVVNVKNNIATHKETYSNCYGDWEGWKETFTVTTNLETFDKTVNPPSKWDKISFSCEKIYYDQEGVALIDCGGLSTYKDNEGWMWECRDFMTLSAHFGITLDQWKSCHIINPEGKSVATSENLWTITDYSIPGLGK